MASPCNWPRRPQTSLYVIANISATAPTGGDPFTAAVGLAPTAPSLGQGFWSVSGSLLCIKPYDPIVFFYGIGTERFFEREFLGLEIRPGAQYTYNFGVGFAVNERVTLSTRFNGAYVEELEVNGERRFGTNFGADVDPLFGNDFAAVRPARGAVRRVRHHGRCDLVVHRRHVDVLAHPQGREKQRNREWLQQNRERFARSKDAGRAERGITSIR